MSLFKQLRGIWKDASFILRNNQKYSDRKVLEVARARRIRAEQQLEEIKAAVAKEDERLEAARLQALQQLDAVKVFSDFVDKEAIKQAESLREGIGEPVRDAAESSSGGGGAPGPKDRLLNRAGEGGKS